MMVMSSRITSSHPPPSRRNPNPRSAPTDINTADKRHHFGFQPAWWRSPSYLPTPPNPPTHTHNLSESLCMTFSVFLQPIEVKITVGCERAEWLYISKITVGIHHCHCDTPSGMNLVKWEPCFGQGPLTVTNAPPVTTNRSEQIASGL